MSVTSSIEKPTTTAVQQQQQQQQAQESKAATTTTATIAIAAGQAQQQQQQQKRKSLNPKRSYSLTSSSASSSGSLGAIRSATSPLVTSVQERKSSAGQAFPPFSYCTDTIAAVHHQRQTYALVQKPPSLRYQGKPHAHTHTHTHTHVHNQPHSHQHQLLANFSPTMTSSEPSSPLAAEGSGSGILSPAEVTTHCCTNVKANITPLATQKMHRTIPSDKINLRLILVSGKTKEFIFSPSDSAGDIAQTVFDNWPEDWTHETVAKAEILRLIYQGRFLHCNVTLGALGLPLGKTTVMHLVPRDNLPEPNSQDQRQNSKGGSGRCCSANCSIL
ncbi:uncharacterized protein LOC108025887 [Drosophila biarmipes]|uniref:uncharacterized protein LOC108025887 n=1 Tax=Drosophila biarmipes TaxID=125945 RepID=UPI0007E67099|nr:uncharacterized protein LOC108025887 [Drosophila biarmipes]XP_050740691.1 uncharacterized protein LOC108025887 [Drosophila biarmipes]